MKSNRHHIGLNDSQVYENRRLYGNNVLSEPVKESLWKQLGEKFADPLIIVLLVAMGLSVIASIYEFVNGAGFSVFLEPLGIMIAVALAIGIAFWFELSADKKFEILTKEEEEQMVKAMRNGNCKLVRRRDIVVGDIVLLDVGDEIPADGLLLEGVSLYVNESTLTGEPSARKTTNASDFVKDATYPSNILLRGTTVIDGNGVMKVTMVGDKTEYGKAYKGSHIDNKIKTPLNMQLDRLSKIITYLSYGFSALIIVGRGWQLFQMADGEGLIEIARYILDTLMIAVTLIVVAVPEGLPMSVSVSLALSMRRMLATNNLVRKMHACETMGAATVICTDKTGTLTQNQMRVCEFVGHSERLPREMLAKIIGICSTANLDFSSVPVKSVGNPTEAALLLWLNDQDLDYRQIREGAEVVNQLAFSTVNKYMATLVAHSETENLLLVKGAPEIVLGYCSKAIVDNNAVALSDELVDEYQAQLSRCQDKAMRTLGFAYAYVPTSVVPIVDGKLVYGDLISLGFAGISDPVRSDVSEAVDECLNAGIKVKIVTGDTPSTACEVARQIGLWTDEDDEHSHITGTDFSVLSDEEAMKRASEIKIMSRARPMDKARLVDMLQRSGEVVAVTGDGTNDAPALKLAQVGLSMGDGTNVAKQASAITILDSSFKSINRAVLWGRSLYRNIQRFLMFQLTINVAACFIVLLGAFIGVESPLTVTQMLWVNLIMDTFAAMALASLPPEESVMKESPRKADSHIISRRMFVTISHIGMTFVVLQLALFGILQRYDIQDVRQIYDAIIGNIEPSGYGLTNYESAIFFTFFVMLQFWNLFNAKAFLSKYSAFAHIHKCPSFLLIAAVILFGQILIVSIGGDMFNVAPLSLTDWIWIVILTSVCLIMGELARLIRAIYLLIIK